MVLKATIPDAVIDWLGLSNRDTIEWRLKTDDKGVRFCEVRRIDKDGGVEVQSIALQIKAE